jgi:hypothetical protein
MAQSISIIILQWSLPRPTLFIQGMQFHLP